MATADTLLRVTLDPRFTRLLQRQDDLQAFKLAKRVADLDDDERAQFIRDMVLALNAEVIEVLDETHWKPWATRPLHEAVIPSTQRFTGELADVFIFFMNLMLAGGIGMTQLAEAVDAKQTKNLQRWTDGYDGKSSKCKACRKSFDDEDVNCYPAAEESGILAYCAKEESFIDRNGARV